MFDDLTPLRRAYGVEAPGEPPTGARPTPTEVDHSGSSGTAGPANAETALLRQTRAAVEATVAAQERRPSAAALDAVLAEAARASAEALAPLAAVRALYNLPRTRSGGEPTTAAVLPVEAEILAQSRTAVERSLSARPQRPSDAAVAAVVARAAEASRLAPRPDARVESPALAPLAVAYGLGLAASAGTPAPAETALLVQTRALLDRAPVVRPSDAAVAAVLARAASASPSAGRPAAPAAPDRAPVRAARSYRRHAAWASALTVAALAVFVLMPRTAVAPPPPGTQAAMALVAEAAPVPSADAEPPADERAAAGDPEAPAVTAGTSGLIASSAFDAPPAAALPAAAPTPRPVSAASSAAPVPALAPVARIAPLAAAPSPPPPPADAAAFSQTPTTALASAVTSAEADESWDAPDDVRVLSLRLQEIRRGNAGVRWDAPSETFGAPTSSALRAAPGLQSVRESVLSGRARLRTAPVPGN